LGCGFGSCRARSDRKARFATTSADAIDDVIDLTRWVSWDEKSAIGLRQVIVTSCENWIRKYIIYGFYTIHIYIYTVYMMFVYVKKKNGQGQQWTTSCGLCSHNGFPTVQIPSSEICSSSLTSQASPAG
jgi:hypothetical protein